jgi:hypothetical protein
MRDAEIADLVDRIVTAARIPSRRRRGELRRELWTHFEELQASGAAAGDAAGRFGSPREIADAFARVYRPDYAIAYVIKVAVTAGLAVGAVLAIESIASLRVGWSHAAVLGVAVGLVILLAREAVRRPFGTRRAFAAAVAYLALCAGARMVAGGAGAMVTATMLTAVSVVSARASRPAINAVATFAAFAAAEYALHAFVRAPFGAGRSLQAAAVLVAVWGATVAIAGRVDRLFASTLTIG